MSCEATEDRVGKTKYIAWYHSSAIINRLATLLVLRLFFFSLCYLGIHLMPDSDIHALTRH